MIFTKSLIESLKSDNLEKSHSYLLEGADPNYVIPSEGVAPIHLAAGLGIKATSLLLEYGGNPNVRSNDGSTPLHVAATWGDEECVKLLLQSGADPHIKDQDGYRPLDVAKLYGHDEVFLYLKYYSLLLLSEDDEQSEKFTRYSVDDGLSDIRSNGNDCNDSYDSDEASNLLDTFIYSQNPDYVFTNTINGQLSHHLHQGNKILFDVTSPDNPYIDYKSSHDERSSDLNKYVISPVSTKLNYKSDACGQKYKESNTSHGRNLSPRTYFCSDELNRYNTNLKPTAFVKRTCDHIQKHGDRNRTPTRSPLPEFQQNMKHISCEQNCRDRDRTPTRSPLPEFQQNFKHSNTLQWVSDHAKLHSSYQQNTHQNNDKTPVNSVKPQKSKSVHGPSSPVPVLKPKLLYSDTNLHKSIGAHHDNKISTIKNPEKHLSATTSICKPCCPDTSHSTSFTSDSDKTLESKSLDAAKELSGCQYSKRQYIKSSNSQIVPRRCQDDRHKFNSQLHNGEWFQNEQTVDNPSFCQQTQSFNFEVCNTCSEDSLSRYTENTDILSGCVPLCNETGFVVNVSDIERENRLAYRQRILDDKCQWYLTNSCHDVNAGNQLTPRARNGCGKQNLRTDCMHQNPTCTSLHRKPSDQNVSPEPFSETLDCSVTDSVNFNLNAAQLSNIVPSECFNNSHVSKSHISEHFTIENIRTEPKIECRSNKRRESDSSCDTFVTCEDGASSKPVSPDPIIELSEQTHKFSSGTTKPVFNEIKVNPTWLPPSALNLDQSDIFSSDSSFIERREAVTVRKKKQCRDVEQMVDLEDRLESFQLDTPATGSQTIAAKPQTNKTSYQEPNRLSIASSVFDTAFYGGNRPSTDSIYSNISVKEYLYRDLDRGITLIERHVPSECGNSTGRLSLDSVTSAKSIDSQKTEEYDWKTYIKPKQNVISVDSRDEDDNETIQLSKQFSQLSNEELRNKLKTMGDDPGPVIASTRQTYLIRLASISKNPGLVMMSKNGPDYSLELRQAMEGKFDMDGLEELEIKMMDLFNNSNGRKWREGALKSSFNYLLLDPRVTKNLPLRAKNMGDLDIFCTFVAAIFYVGKGKRSRPYTHLYEAISQMNKPKTNVSDKVQQILDIWSSGQGVVSLHIFQNIIPVEAYTREGCIIQTISLDKLTNKKKGDFYGVASTWSMKTKRQMGVYFLKKALQIFLGEGERQICPPDIKTGQ